jgi:hypothetical protein
VSVENWVDPEARVDPEAMVVIDLPPNKDVPLGLI